MRLDLILVAGLLVANVANAGSLEAGDTVTKAIKSHFPGREVKVLPNGGHLMPDCRSTLKVASMPSEQSGSRTVSVSCEAPAWTVYAGVLIKHEAAVFVARTNIPAGAHIDRADVSRETVDVLRLHGTPLTPALISQSPAANQPITRDQPILISMVDIPLAIRNGDTVRVAVVDDGVVVTADATALQSGPVGAMIEAENQGSHKRLSAEIVKQIPSHNGIFVMADPARGP